MSQTSIFASGRPSTTRLLDRLFDFVQSHIFTYQFSAHNFIREEQGVRIDPDLAITLWTNARLLAEGINITPDVITYCNDHRLPLPPRVLTYNYATGYNPLLESFRSQAAAVNAVQEAQEEGSNAVQWIVFIAQELLKGREVEYTQLKPKNMQLLDYYKSLTWPGYDEHGNTCREVIKYDPFPSRYPPYSPLDPRVLDEKNSTPPVPPNSPERHQDLSDFGISRNSFADRRITGGSIIADHGSVSSDNEHGGVFRVVNEESKAERAKIMRGCF